ncbi:unnamed protein product [Rhizopus stolonifer]
MDYCKHYIYNLNPDILRIGSIQQLDKEGISVESLLDAPLKQLNIYKSHLNELSPSFKPQANQLLDNLMNSIVNLSSIDTLNVTDIITQKPVTRYQLGPISRILIDQSYYCVELKKNIQVLLTKQSLILTSNNQLLFPSLPVNLMQIRSTDPTQLQLSFDQKRFFTLTASSKEQVCLWSANDSWLDLEKVILAQTRPKSIKTKDLFSFYNDPAGEISPIESSDEEENTNTNTATLSDTMQTSISSPLPPPPLPQHSKVPEKELPKTPPEKKSSFMRSVLSLGPRSRKSQMPASNQSAVSLDSSCSSSQSSLATPPMSRSNSPAVHRFQTEEEESTPPASPDMHKIKQVLYQNEQCQVFHWKEESWYAANECIVQVRETHGQRSCVTVHLKGTDEMYLNAWIILPGISIQRISETDINLTVQTAQEENYLIHCTTSEEADQLDQILQHQLINQTVFDSSDAHDSSLQLAMECKCKLYLQSSSSKWSSFGSVHLKVSQHSKSKRMHMAVESSKGDKVQLLVSAMVQSRNVERLGPKQISFLFTSEKTSMVYMVKVREELIGDKILEYLKEKNAEQGW